MDLLRALAVVAFASTPALADSSEAEPPPSRFSLGIGSSFSGQPVLVSQQWRSETAGIQYTLGIRWDRVSVDDTATNVYALDLGTWFLFNIARRGRTQATLLAGAEGSAVSAAGVRGGSALFGFGLQVQRRVTETIGIYAQTGLSVSL